VVTTLFVGTQPLETLMPLTASDQLLVARIRQGDAQAWEELVARYEGRLLAYIEARVPHRADAEDLVQETFLGFLVSLPNFDESRDLGAYLFSIAAHKVTDHLRRTGRRPWEGAHSTDGSGRPLEEFTGRARTASSAAASAEGHRIEERVLAEGLAQLVKHWKTTGQYERLKCMELILVRGWRNKEVAEALGISQQAVANYKRQTLEQLQKVVHGHPAIVRLLSS
jgi:RNA polymerase sigma-70 factor (ECF subfamily)